MISEPLSPLKSVVTSLIVGLLYNIQSAIGSFAIPYIIHNFHIILILSNLCYFSK